MDATRQADLARKHDTFSWEITNRSSCDVCYEPYDSSIVIPRVLSCGHTRCEQCIVKCAQENLYKCICQKKTVVRDVRTLPINRSLIDISDYMNGLTASIKPVEACTDCNTVVELKWLAVCKTAECEKFRQLICLSCAMKRHSKHEFVLYERVMDDSFFDHNDTAQLLLSQTKGIIDEQEAAELLSIATSFLDPITSELGSMISGLEYIKAGIDNEFGKEPPIPAQEPKMYVPLPSEDTDDPQWVHLHTLFDL